MIVLNAHLLPARAVKLPLGQTGFMYRPWAGARIHQRCTLRGLGAGLQTDVAHVLPSAARLHDLFDHCQIIQLQVRAA
jgi:hypothetical protein